MNRKQRRAPTKGNALIGRGASSSVQKVFADAFRHHHVGRLEEAERLYRQVLTLNPRHADSLHLLGVIALDLGRPDMAVDLIVRAIAINAKVAFYHSNLGNALQRQGRLDEAVACYRKALVLKSDYAEAHHNLGVAFKAQGLLDASVACHREAIALRPDYVEAYINLGNALQEQGKLDEAADSYRQAIIHKPDYVEAHNNLGVALKEQGRVEDAVACYRRALVIKPNYLEALNNLGNALQDQKKLDEAIVCYRRALVVKPDYPEVHNNLGIAFREKGLFDEAVACHVRALALRPDFPEVHCGLGNALKDMGRFDEAEANFRQALAIKPDFAIAHNNLGHVLRDVGRLDEARQHIAKAIELAPDEAQFYFNMAELKRFAVGDPQLAAMEALAEEISTLSADDQVHLRFALGKVYEDMGEFDWSFRHLLAGNAVKRHQVGYDEVATLGLFGRTQAVFTREFIAGKSLVHEPGDGPIFIVGMARSGTTLVEQILASHPQVFGAGEVDLFGKAVFDLAGRRTYPEAVLQFPADSLQRLGAGYVTRLRTRAPDATRITDKMPQNFLFCGLIHLALPNARIVHMRRDPIDTCLSCFSKLFAGRQQPYSYDLGELGRYYRSYENLMEHWRGALPVGVMLDVQYEDVVGDLEGQTRRILAHCGLDWDEACLTFHKTERPVRTASATQVRQPIFKTSVGRWRPAPDLLRPLTDELGSSSDEGRGDEAWAR